MSAEAPDDDASEHDPQNRPRPDPLDRTWVHPTELRSFVANPELAPRETRPREWVIGIVSAATGVALTLMVLVAFGSLGGRHRAAVPPPVVTNPNFGIDFSVAARVAAAVAPSVVTVHGGTEAAPTNGSGVIIRADRIITSAHLLNGAAPVEVVTGDGNSYPAKVVGSDPETDLALLEVSGADLPLASLGSSAESSVGDVVVAVAATRGTRYKLDLGVVSDRDLLAQTGTGVMVAGLLETGFRTDGDWTGGALVDPNGNIIGVLTSPVGTVRAGLAVPIGTVRDVEDQLDASGKVSHGWMGVLYAADDTQRARRGARVGAVVPDGPAAKAGLTPGDVVTHAGTADISGSAELVAAARRLHPQDPLELIYWRGSRSHRTTVTLGTADPNVLAGWPAMG